ncbi:unnamed protein product [Kuraishia capsulata CBS 1993]|uniref:Chromatin modification-related protein EAF1 n=1 Tax=Kuraishia capsulata CBS 1993 TaxID=1382522 RepID=W6MFF8_9ASCO|nr:uncharacterized protein KUCA_T00000489001 [Kuraishia capsulata CBS 1993]CDK24524.1 unnamed protein product [Kuraishia capsulata CBS 1993]
MSSGQNISIDRIRLESIEHRRQTCNQVIKSRKRKLGELYCISRSPLLPISDDQVLQMEDKLMAFLEKNELENGHEFDIVTLTEKQNAAMAQQQKAQAIVSGQAQRNEGARTDIERLSSEPSLTEGVLKDDQPLVEPPQKLTKSDDLSVSLQAMESSKEESEADKPDSLVITERHIENSPDEAPTLSSLIRKRAEKESFKRADQKTSRDLDISQVEMNDLLVLLMPEKLPHKVLEATSLTELYYHSQTLPIINLILRTHKSLSTDAYETALLEGKLAVLYSRIEELKRQKKWSLRQPKKYFDPFKKTQTSHWDHLLSEMKWLSTDFREERKYKMVQCYYISQAVTDYWNYGKVMCVKRKPIKHLEPEEEGSREDSGDVDMEKPEGVDDRVEEDAQIEEDTIDVSLLLQRPDANNEIIPKDLPSYTEDEVKQLLTDDSATLPFKLYANMEQLNGVSASILEKLPVYEPLKESSVSPDTFSGMPIDPISSLVSPLDQDEEEWYKLLFKKTEEHEKNHPDYQKGLFGVATHRRFTLLRPPPPPSIKNLELRIPTIWLPQDDKLLIRYVTEYSFNWGVISAHLSPKPTRNYTSNIERRTPWQCFERYIQLNDKFQFTDMRGVYAAAAKEWLEAAHKAQTTTKRRISPLGVGPESIQRGHRRLRWGSMFDAIRKLMKKRENAPKPNTQPRRSTSDEKRMDTPTPAALSRLKYERDKAIQEAYMHQTNANGAFPRARVAGAAVAPVARAAQPGVAGQSAIQGVAGARPATQDGAQRTAAVARAPSAVSVTPANAAAAAANIAQRRLNGQGGPLTGPNGIPYTNEQLQQLMQLQKQRQLLQKSGATPPPGAGTSAATHPIAGGVVKASPIKTDGRVLNFSAQQVSAIINQIQSQNPNMTKEQVTKLAAAYIASLQQQSQNRNAANQAKIAQGSASGDAKSDGTPTGSPSPVDPSSLTAQQRSQLALARSQLQRRQMMLQQQQQSAQIPSVASSQVGSPVNVHSPIQLKNTADGTNSSTQSSRSPVNGSTGTRTRSAGNHEK